MGLDRLDRLDKLDRLRVGAMGIGGAPVPDQPPAVLLESGDPVFLEDGRLMLLEGDDG